jgi:hypothetical protein
MCHALRSLVFSIGPVLSFCVLYVCLVVFPHVCFAVV